MRLLVNGANLAPYMAAGGLTWKRNDVDSPNAGRDMSGTMRRGRVTSKVTIDCKCRALTGAEAAVVLTAIDPESVLVGYDDPKDGFVEKTFYVSSCPATHLMVRGNVDYWEGISFTMVEL